MLVGESSFNRTPEWIRTVAVAWTTTGAGPLDWGVEAATATVRILSGVRLKLDSPTNTDGPLAHDTVVKTDGTQQPARLIEFQ